MHQLWSLKYLYLKYQKIKGLLFTVDTHAFAEQMFEEVFKNNPCIKLKPDSHLPKKVALLASLNAL